MGELHVHEFMTMDGVIDAPEWSFDFGFSEGQGKTMSAVTEECEGILLGRKTYEMFEPSWSTRTVEDDPGAPFFNEKMKYVVSSTLTDENATWRNSEVLGPYDPDAIRKLKDEIGDLYTSGSITLVRSMLDDGLVDQLHLWVFPLTRPGGPRLFTDEATPKKMELATSEQYDNGVLYLNLRKQS